MVWSFKEEDPPISAVEEPFAAHDYKGTASLNLLGGLLDRPQDPPGTKNFTVGTDNVSMHSYIQIRMNILVHAISISPPLVPSRSLFPKQIPPTGVLVLNCLRKWNSSSNIS